MLYLLSMWTPARIVFVFGLLSISACWCFGENGTTAPYHWKNSPKFVLSSQYKPLKGWRIESVPPGTARVYLNDQGKESQRRGTTTSKNTALKGPDESLYYLLFDYRDYRSKGGPPIAELEKDPQRPVFLGWDYHDFATRFNRKTGERGLARNYVKPLEFACQYGSAPLNIPKFHVDQSSHHSDWQRFVMPLVEAEGDGNYLAINSFDRAGMTVGFMQMAAHTPNDLIPLMKHLLLSKELQSCSYAHPNRWFPELGITRDGKLGYRSGSQIYSLEEVTSERNSNEGFNKWAYFREDFVRLCNPSVRTIDNAELEFAARWMMWSMSPKMRQAQLEPTLLNVIRTLNKLDKAPRKVSAADAAIAAVILHWKDGEEYRKLTTKLLHEKCAVTTFMKWEGSAGKKVARTDSEHKILRQRVVAVRELFERQPALYHRLQDLTFNFQTGRLEK